MAKNSRAADVHGKKVKSRFRSIKRAIGAVWPTGHPVLQALVLLATIFLLGIRGIKL